MSTVESLTRGTAQWELGKLRTKEKEISRKMKSFKNNMEIGSPLRKQGYVQENNTINTVDEDWEDA